jgi:hypothetical protein
MLATLENSQRTRNKALIAIFASAARVAVLRVFMIDPTRAYYQRQIEQANGLPIRAIQRELERLSAVGLLFRHTEGNRAYYQVDTSFPFFPELRAMLVKSGSELESLRAALATNDAALLAFQADTRNAVLVVSRPGRTVVLEAPAGWTVEIMSIDEFGRALAERRESLDPFLVRGVDILGRREDVIWRHIEAAGYNVPKGEGVP